jgi:hypothetical protein
VAEIHAGFINVTVKTASGKAIIDFCMHPETRIRKITSKIRTIFGLFNYGLELVLTKELADEDLIEPFLSQTDQPTLFLHSL